MASLRGRAAGVGWSSAAVMAVTCLPGLGNSGTFSADDSTCSYAGVRADEPETAQVGDAERLIIVVGERRRKCFTDMTRVSTTMG